MSINTSKPWSIGFIDGWNFHSFEEYDVTDSVDAIIRRFKRNAPFNVHKTSAVTVLIPENLQRAYRFRRHIDNRFVYCWVSYDFHGRIYPL